MLKATYAIKGTYSSKHANDGHLMARSLTHLSRSTIRGALLASAFKYKGAGWAEEHFYQIKEAMIYPQSLCNFSKQQEKRTRLSTNAIEKGLSVSEAAKETIKPHTFDDVGSLTTVGIREYVYADTISFFIDETIDDIMELLSNISRLGDSESLVQLVRIERTDEMDDVLFPTTAFDYTKNYTRDWDWALKTTFEQVNAYSKKYNRKTVELNCETKSIAL